MRIKFENEILNIETRKKIIEEIEGSENRARKAESYKRAQCYKDETSNYVVENLISQFDLETVQEMRYAISNLSIARKIIDKLARVYSAGANRALEGDENTKKIQELARRLCLQSEMKRTNRILKLQRNCAFYVKPCPQYNAAGAVESWKIKPEVLHPYLYDVVEDYNDRTQPLVFVLSNYKPEPSLADQFNLVGRPTVTGAILGQTSSGDGIDQKIADNPADEASEKKTYVFWSKNYHFTCDSTGAILQDPGNEQNKNPFGVSLLINFAIDQDGSFWAKGGKDLIDGAVLINSLVSHINHVGVVQGYGQFYATGENLPRSFKVGPTKAIIAEYKKDEQAEPKFGFLNANPQLDSLRGLVEMYIALLLTTNNLSTSGVASQLSGGQDLASGIALAIDKAESLEDVQDQRQIFIDKEPEIFEAINAIIEIYGNQLDEEMRALVLPKDFKKSFSLKFHDAQTIMSEKEKLENLKLRQELGLDTMISLLMKDDPSLTQDQAEEKLKKLLEDKIKERMMQEELMRANGIEVGDPQDPNADPNQDPNADPNGDPEDESNPNNGN